MLKTCQYCGEAVDEHLLLDHENKHDVVFVPLLRSDLNRLVNFMAIRDENLITETLWKALFRFVRGN